MKRLKKFITKKLDKVNVQVSFFACVLVVFSCLIIYLVTSGIFVSILADAYKERADLTFNTIESHIDKKLYMDDYQEGVYGAAMEYLSITKDNMAVSEISLLRKKSNGDVIYIVDTNDDKNDEIVRDRKATGKIKKRVDELYITNIMNSGDFYSIDEGYRYVNLYPVTEGGSNVKGVVCICINAERVHTIQIVLRILVTVIILLCCVISTRFSKRIFRKISNPLYQDASNTDNLTGLKNKNSFSVDMHNIEVGSKERYSIVTIDLNGLKHINDTRGHQAGDMYIQRAAKAIRTAMAGNPAYIGYRIGGDEFSIVIKDVEIPQIEEFISKLNNAVDAQNKTSGIVLSMSTGYAKFDPEKDRNFSMTIERSDSMMYENKRLYYEAKNKKPRQN